MKANCRRKSLKRRFNRFATTVAGAAIISSALLPGIPAATAYAAVKPNAGNTPVAAPAPPDSQTNKSQDKTTEQQLTDGHNGPPNNFERVLDITATAYAPGPHDNDQWGNKTFIGTQIRPGVIAVDPKVIPLGSQVYIQYPDGHGTYAVAEDTGGAIKGNRIDIAKWTVNEAEDFGIQDVKVFVLNSPETKSS